MLISTYNVIIILQKNYFIPFYKNIQNISKKIPTIHALHLNPTPTITILPNPKIILKNDKHRFLPTFIHLSRISTQLIIIIPDPTHKTRLYNNNNIIKWLFVKQVQYVDHVCV
jgi:hypothetical protein